MLILWNIDILNNCSVLKYFKMLFIPILAKLNFQQPLQSSVSCDPLKMILICWFVAPEVFIIIIYYTESSSFIIFVETVINVRLL